jgi:hypothetical protein
MADVPEAAALAWAREQVEQVAVKYDGYAEREPNPILKSALQLTARLMRLELCGGENDGKRILGRFEPGFFDEQSAQEPR